MTIRDNLQKVPISTIPDDTKDPPRFGQPVETTKDVFLLELRKFFNRDNQTVSFLEELPNIRKFDLSFDPNESSLSTAVNLIQRFPDADENLPLVAILGATGRNMPMAIGGTHVTKVIDAPFVINSLEEPFALQGGDTIVYKTTTHRGDSHISTIILRASRFANIAQATAKEVVYEINFQSLYARGLAGGTNQKNVVLSYGGSMTQGVKGSIEIIGGTALPALGFTVGQSKSYSDMTPYNRYVQSTSVDIAMEVVGEDPNIRTELTDLIWNFFTFQMNDRDYIFLGRSVTDLSIPNETFQIIIKVDPSLSGEQEVPRPGDEKDKLFVNRMNLSVTTLQYIDKAVLIPNTNTPYYMSTPVFDDTMPFKN